MRHHPSPSRGVAQLGSAFDWGSKGRWFKSSRPDSLQRVKRGKLIKLKAKPGTELPAATGVDAVFSKGKWKR